MPCRQGTIIRRLYPMQKGRTSSTLFPAFFLFFTFFFAFFVFFFSHFCFLHSFLPPFLQAFLLLPFLSFFFFLSLPFHFFFPFFLPFGSSSISSSLPGFDSKLYPVMGIQFWFSGEYGFIPSLPLLPGSI